MLTDNKMNIKYSLNCDRILTNFDFEIYFLSNIQHLPHTLITAPSPPIITNTLPETRNVTITWLPPVRPNGPIKYYIITWWIEGSLDDPVGSEQIQPVPDKQPIYTINELGKYKFAMGLVEFE